MARLAFFGTPAFADIVFEGLLATCARLDHEVLALVAQPDRKKGRGKKMQPPPTKVRAMAHDIEVLQPATLKKGTEPGEAFFARYRALDLDLAVVAAYGRIIPTRVLKTPRQGSVNVHGSLLPRWRGAAPVQRALQAGDGETGVGLMDMIYALDEGDVYVEGRLPIVDEDDAASLSVKVAQLGARLLDEHLEAILAGTLATTPQADEGVTYASMLEKGEARLAFDAPARDVINHVRAMVPWPGSEIVLDGVVHKVFGPHNVPGVGAPGTVVAAKDQLVIACAERAVAFDEIQAPGKKRLPVRSFVAGRPIAPGTKVV